MIIEQSDIYNFADDNILHSWRDKLTKLKENLIFHTKSILNLFISNSLKSNSEKFMFLGG